MSGRDLSAAVPPSEARGASEPAILLLPGALGRVDSLRPALERLGARRRTLAMGYGGLIRPDAHAAAIDELLQRNGCTRVHLVGFSLGATIAMFAATLLARRFESLVLVGAGAPDAARGRRIARVLPLLRLAPAFLLRKRFGPEVLAVRERQAAFDLAAPALRPLPRELRILRLDLERDDVIPAAERARLAELAPNAIVETLPGLSHAATLQPPPALLERIESWTQY